MPGAQSQGCRIGHTGQALGRSWAHSAGFEEGTGSTIDPGLPCLSATPHPEHPVRLPCGHLRVAPSGPVTNSRGAESFTAARSCRARRVCTWSLNSMLGRFSGKHLGSVCLDHLEAIIPTTLGRREATGLLLLRDPCPARCSRECECECLFTGDGHRQSHARHLSVSCHLRPRVSRQRELRG